MKIKSIRILSVCIAVVILLAVVPLGSITASAATSGKTGNCTWRLEGTVLTISGSGSTGGYAYKGEYGNVEYEIQPWGREITDVYINEGVTHIGDACFYLCSKLKNITIAGDVEYFGNKNFYNCNQLENVYIKDINAWCNIYFEEFSSNPLYYAKNLFLNKKLVKEISVPNTVNKIKQFAFMYRKLEKITLPNTITQIDLFAFSNCKNLTNIVIPDSVETIGSYAFEGCSSIIEINIPKNVKTIGNKVFFYCTNLKSINVDKENKFFTSIEGILYNKDKTQLIFCPSAKSGDVIIPEGVISINSPNMLAIAAGDAYGGFVDCNSIQNLVIPNSIELSACFLHRCHAENVVLSEGFTSINQLTFFGSSVKNICLPKSITNIETSAFRYSDLTDVWYSGNKNDRQKIKVCDDNTSLLDAKWHYNVCDYNKHIYSNDSDTKCNKCDWVRKICTHKFNNNCDTSCNICGKTRKITHILKTTTTKATISKNGKIVKKCTVCGYVKSTTAIKYAKTFKLSTTSYTYNGKVKTPTVTVKDSAGKVLKKNTDYTVDYAKGRKNAGTYKVTIKMKGNYTGTKILIFKINPINISKCTVKLSATSYTYNGKVKTPSVTVKNANGTTLTKGTHYTVTYASGRKNVGTYKVTIKMKGNYSGTKTLTFKINPVKTTVSKLTAGKKSITVAITKKSTQVMGYQIQYSTSKKFTKAKTKTISSYKTKKYTLKSLSAKKTYYVRVRTYKTVGKTKYYSGWSTYKYVKTK